MTLDSVYMGEICPKCHRARLIHPEVYVYTCLACRFSYRVNPVNRKKPITILHESEVKKN